MPLNIRAGSPPLCWTCALVVPVGKLFPDEVGHESRFCLQPARAALRQLPS